ncbi:hypothetical protein ACQB6R_05745 [Propionibacteriaceae bacterium G1746]|uniref:hypothetical protein n=1 Tax=Aestuariimicrobium sp. G57 TaxID=3418485 RepID=UPI003C27FC89
MSLDDEFDEFDPVAAPVLGIDADVADETGDDDLSLLVRPNEPWTPEAGFPDTFGVLRLWVDDTKLITKVRLSPSWREKLGKRPLTHAFAQAFSFINSYDPDTSDSGLLDTDKSREAKYPLSWDRLDHLTRESARVSDRIDTLGDGGRGHWEGKPAVGESPDRLAAIELTLEGDLASVVFHPQKLDEARIRQVTDAVVRAHANARANFVPGRYVPGERDELTAQLNDIRQEMLAMMRRGFR